LRVRTAFAFLRTEATEGFEGLALAHHLNCWVLGSHQHRWWIQLEFRLLYYFHMSLFMD
jgi:hypothetical protein